MQQYIGFAGIALLLGLAWTFSTNRRAISKRVVLVGLCSQFVFAFIVTKSIWGQKILFAVSTAIVKVLEQGAAGAEFVFGDAARAGGNIGFVFAFNVMPVLIFIAALFEILYYYGIMQFFIRQVARLMMWAMGVSGAESLDVAASIFLGQNEAPLTIRPFVAKLTQSEMMTVMVAGMAHVSGSIMAAYIACGANAYHILGAVIMTAPGSFLMAKMLVPETEKPETLGVTDLGKLMSGERPKSVLAAIGRGTADGLHMVLNICGMLIAFLSLIALINFIFGHIHAYVPLFPVTIQQVVGWIFAPIAFLIGIPWEQAIQVGGILGGRMVTNELVAFTELGKLKDVLDPRSFAIATYAICGFANFSSIGIQMGGIGALAPNRMDDLAKLGFRAMLAGTAANLISAAIVGMLI